MARVIVVGDGPGGLSAALFLAKNGHETVVYGQDETAMHFADLHNYLGIPHVSGSDFQRVAREQVTAHGAELRDAQVTAVTPSPERVTVATEDGTTDAADYVILAAGKQGRRLAEAIGLEQADGAVVVDAEGRTSADRCYAVGRLTRPNRSQAVISAGAGARAALDIFAREAGNDVTDWDTPPDGG